MIPPALAPVLTGFILSGLMSLIVSGVSTFHAMGPADGFLRLWVAGWLTAWLVAFPAVLLAAPLTRRLVVALLSD